MVQNKHTKGKITINGNPVGGLKVVVYDQDYSFGVPVFSSKLGTATTDSNGNYSVSYSPDKYGNFPTDEDRVETHPGSVWPPAPPTYGPGKPDIYIEVYQGSTLLKKSAVKKDVSSETCIISFDISQATADNHPDAYDYAEMPPEEVAVLYPCTEMMHWPGYDTKVIETKINGREVVIQLWKGLCPSYMPGMVGGIGAEVGIYHKDWQPGLWWPDNQHKQEISFTLVNPITNEEFFTADTKHCWWRHKWMTIHSYAEYILNNHNHVPISQTEYKLKFTINGHPFKTDSGDEFVW